MTGLGTEPLEKLLGGKSPKGKKSETGVRPLMKSGFYFNQSFETQRDPNQGGD
jgi:hypothetical protein